MKLSIVLPAYKEAENLSVLLPNINDVLKQLGGICEILVVDTMQPMDKTPQIVMLAGAKYVSRRGGNRYGDAIRTGIADAQGDYILFMDADGSHNPDDIARLYEEAETKRRDIVIGSRYMKGGSTENPLLLIWMSNVLNRAYRIVFRIKVKDVSNSLRIYRGDLLKAIPLECDNFDIVEEILIRSNARYKNLNISEIPIRFCKRQYGESKRDLIKFIISYMKTMYKLVKIAGKEKSSMMPHDESREQVKRKEISNAER